jgi:hypothetical protein
MKRDPREHPVVNCKFIDIIESNLNARIAHVIKDNIFSKNVGEDQEIEKSIKVATGNIFYLI